MKKIRSTIFVVFMAINLSFSVQGNCHSLQNTADTLVIIGERIWVRAQPVDGKVLFTLNNGAVCSIVEKGREQIIRGNKDYWYKIYHQEKTGWVFGSQSSVKQEPSLRNIEPFLEYFLQTCFYGKNTDSLFHVKDAYVQQFIHNEIGFWRLYNPGTTCTPQAYNFYDNEYGRYYGVSYLKMQNPDYYAEQAPQGGFCDESLDSDGIYYQKVEQLPSYPDIGNDYKIKSFPIPQKYQAGLKIKVQVLYDKMIKKTMYFMVANNQWWLVVIDDCDCSA